MFCQKTQTTEQHGTTNHRLNALQKTATILLIAFLGAVIVGAMLPGLLLFEHALTNLVHARRAVVTAGSKGSS